MELCFLSSFFQSADRVRKSKRFQQMGPCLISPSVSQVHENEAEPALYRAATKIYGLDLNH